MRRSTRENRKKLESGPSSEPPGFSRGEVHMSRSVRKHPFAAYCGGSQKKTKVCCNRSLRHRNRLCLTARGETAMFSLPDEVMSAWEMPQDGTRGYRSWAQYWKRAQGAQPTYRAVPRPPPDQDKEYHRWFKWVKMK